MTEYIQHMEPEENYGGGAEYYDSDDGSYEEEEMVVEEEEEYYEEVDDDESYAEEVVEEEEEEEEYQPPSGGGMAAMIAAAANKRQERLDQGVANTPVVAPRHVPQQIEAEQEEEEEAMPEGGMAAMIAAAANKRKNRLDQGGEKKMTHVEPPPNQGMDLTALIAQKANSRNERIQAGGELKIREIPKAHKNVFVDVALEAARIGTLTRLNEHTVVAVSKGKEVEEWKGPSGLRTDHLRSTMFMAINEAAAMGKMRRLKPVEVTNYDQDAYYEEEEPEDIDKMTDEHGRRVIRQLYLIDRRIEEERKYKEEEWSAENAANVVRYNSIEEVALPSATAPKWKPKQTEKSHRELMDAISLGVAERAWERNYRLGRPKALLQVTRKCKCKFCVNPNPYQTHKYKQMEEAGIHESEGPVLEAPKEEKKSAKAWNQHVKNTRNVKPGEWSESSSYTPVPTAVPMYTPTRPPPKPIADSAPQPEPASPEPVEEPETSDEPGVTVLLDETMTWGHKRERTPKPKKEKKEKKTKKKSKKKTKDEGCCIM